MPWPRSRQRWLDPVQIIICKGGWQLHAPTTRPAPLFTCYLYHAGSLQHYKSRWDMALWEPTFGFFNTHTYTPLVFLSRFKRFCIKTSLYFGARKLCRRTNIFQCEYSMFNTVCVFICKLISRIFNYHNLHQGWALIDTPYGLLCPFLLLRVSLSYVDPNAKHFLTMVWSFHLVWRSVIIVICWKAIQFFPDIIIKPSTTNMIRDLTFCWWTQNCQL